MNLQPSERLISSADGTCLAVSPLGRGSRQEEADAYAHTDDVDLPPPPSRTAGGNLSHEQIMTQCKKSKQCNEDCSDNMQTLVFLLQFHLPGRGFVIRSPPKKNQKQSLSLFFFSLLQAVSRSKTINTCKMNYLCNLQKIFVRTASVSVFPPLPSFGTLRRLKCLFPTKQ